MNGAREGHRVVASSFHAVRPFCFHASYLSAGRDQKSAAFLHRRARQGPNGQHADHVRCGCVALAEVVQRKLGFRPIHRAPDRAVGECFRLYWGQAGTSAGGIDRQIEGSVNRIGLGENLDHVVLLPDGGNLRFGLQGDAAAGFHGGIQGLKQGRAVYGEAVGIWIVQIVGHIENAVACVGLEPEHMGDAVPPRCGRIKRADIGKHLLPDRLNHEARAYGFGGGELIKKRDVMALICKQAGRCQPAHARPDDCDVHS